MLIFTITSKYLCHADKHHQKQDSITGPRLHNIMPIVDFYLKQVKHLTGFLKPSAYTWNAILWENAKLGQHQFVLDLYNQMQVQGVKCTEYVYVTVLKSCSMISALEQGVRIHQQIIMSGMESYTMVGNTLIDMYAKCGNLEIAREVFSSLPQYNVVSWNAILTGSAHNGEGLVALECFKGMQKENIKPSIVTFLASLKACSNIGVTEQGKFIHCHIIRQGFECDIVVGTALVDMYAKCGWLDGAYKVFTILPNRNVISWGAIIAGYANHGEVLLALDCFHMMQTMGIQANVVLWGTIIAGFAQYGEGVLALEYFEKVQQEGIMPNNVIFLSALKACVNMGALEHGRLIHEKIITSRYYSDVMLGNTLVDMYAKCGSLDEACKVFNNLQKRDVVSWNAMITGYVQSEECVSAAVECFGKMLQGGIKPNVVSWNSMIAGFVDGGEGNLALDYFEKMQQEGIKPNSVTFLAVLKACASIGAIDKGRNIHKKFVKSGLHSDVVGNTLVHMYAKSGSLEEACRIFDGLPNKDVVSWNAMITAYAQHGQTHLALECFEKMQESGMKPNVISWSSLIAGYAQHGDGSLALECFDKMQEQGIKPTSITFLSTLKACAIMGGLDQGRLVHKEIIGNELQSDIVIGNTLIDMYCKCGSLDEAFNVFNSLSDRDVISWNAIIAGYAQHGEGLCALECLQKMHQHGIKPTEISLTSVFVACSHAGLLDKAQWCFQTMQEYYDIRPTILHYTSMVDLLGRAGCLNEAEDLLCTTFEADTMAYLSLLSSSCMHGNTELGKHCFDAIISLNFQYAADRIFTLDALQETKSDRLFRHEKYIASGYDITDII